MTRILRVVRLREKMVVSTLVKATSRCTAASPLRSMGHHPPCVSCHHTPRRSTFALLQRTKLSAGRGLTLPFIAEELGDNALLD